MKFNPDKDLLATLINSMWRIVSGPIVLICIPIFLSPLEQGYWYTFSSIAALSIFADLGFSTIILQFAAHEFAHLKFDKKRRFCGESKYIWRLASFFRFSIKWILTAIFIVFPLILIGGYFFLNAKHDNLNWQMAWIIYAVASGIVFFNSSILCFFEGCNSVSLLQSIRFKIGICQTITTLSGLVLGVDIYALSCSLLVAALAGMLFIIYYFRISIKQLWEESRINRYNWWPEFSSLIWKYAVSWCSGYLIFQLFTPLAFQFHGAEFSGKIGISIAMWSAGFSIANTWITAIIPKLNILISNRDWTNLDQIFYKNLIRSLATMAVGGLAYFGIYFLLKDEFTFFQRILDPFSMGLLFLSWLCQLWVNTVATYLRAHKEEPMMKISFISGIYIAITTFLCAKYLPNEFLFLGFISSFLFSIPVTFNLWKKYKKRHAELNY